MLLEIKTENGIDVLKILPSGKIEINPQIPQDQAVVLFWEEVSKWINISDKEKISNKIMLIKLFQGIKPVMDADAFDFERLDDHGDGLINSYEETRKMFY